MSRSVLLTSYRSGPLLALLGLSLTACGSDTNTNGETGDDAEPSGQHPDADGGGNPGDKPGGDKPSGDKPSGDKPSGGSKDPGGNKPDDPRTSLFDPDKPLLPWKEGNTWTYRVVGSGIETMKVTTVGPEEPVGGSGPNRDKLAFKITTTKGFGDRTVSWQASMGLSVIRYREESYFATTGQLKQEEHWDPYKIHIDGSAERMAPGASWAEEYEETKTLVGAMPITTPQTDNWYVDSPNEEVTVPAGTFRAVVFQKAGIGTPKTYWYVPGIGKVKETGGQTEELVSYEVSP